MATYKKQLQDKDGNTIYPDVGIDLDNVVYGDDPTTPTTVTPWVNTDDIQDGAVTSDKIDFTTFTISPDPVLAGVYTLSGTTYNRYIKRVKVDGLKSLSQGSYVSLADVVPNGAVYVMLRGGTLVRTLAGNVTIFEACPNYQTTGSVAAIVDANRALRVYNYGGIVQTDNSVSYLVDIEYMVSS